MTDHGLFSVGDFAKLSRTTLATLHYYDKLGLISPVARGENKYRYYSNRQLAVINVIRTLQELGMPLAEIKSVMDRRTPELMDEVLALQLDNTQKTIDGWIRAQKLLLTFRQSIQSVQGADETAVTIQSLPAEAIILGEPNDYSGGKNAYDALSHFYRTIGGGYSPDLDLNYPVWGVFSAERIRRGDWVWPDRYYFRNPDGHDQRPAGLYAIGYARAGYGQSDDLYKRIVEYIDRNGFEICGDAYEEYPLNEICIVDDTNYLMRIMVTVRERKHGV